MSLPAHITVVTWNVWFGQEALDLRARALWQILADLAPDVICLQEVTGEFWQQVAPLAQGTYRAGDLHKIEGPSQAEYTEVILAKEALLPHFGRVELPSYMGRGLSYVTFGDPKVVVGCVHLESKKEHREVRIEQLEAAIPHLSSLAKEGLLCGDFNFADGAKGEEQAIQRAARDGSLVARDLWPTLKGAQPGYTVDTAINTMARRDKGKDKQVRFDRIVHFHQKAQRWLYPRRIEILGTAPIATSAFDEIFPSDHFGLSCAVTAQG